MLDGDNRAWVRANPISTGESILSRAKAHLRESFSASSSRAPLLPLPLTHSVNAGDLISTDPDRNRNRASTTSHPIAEPLEGEIQASVSPTHKNAGHAHEHDHDKAKPHVHFPELSPVADRPIVPRLRTPDPQRRNKRTLSPDSANKDTSQSKNQAPNTNTHAAELLEEDNIAWTELSPASPVQPVINAFAALKSPIRRGTRRFTLSFSDTEMPPRE